MADLDTLRALVRKVHAAKGRHHTQFAMCDLFDAVGLPNVRPAARTHINVARMTAEEMSGDVVTVPADRWKNEAGLDASWSDVVSTGGMDPRCGISEQLAALDISRTLPVVDRKRPCDTEGGSHD